VLRHVTFPPRQTAFSFSYRDMHLFLYVLCYTRLYSLYYKPTFLPPSALSEQVNSVFSFLITVLLREVIRWWNRFVSPLLRISLPFFCHVPFSFLSLLTLFFHAGPDCHRFFHPSICCSRVDFFPPPLFLPLGRDPLPYWFLPSLLFLYGRVLSR